MPWLLEGHLLKLMMSKLPTPKSRTAIIRILRMSLCQNMQKVLSPKCFKEIPDTEPLLRNCFVTNFSPLLLSLQPYPCQLWPVLPLLISLNNSVQLQ